MTNVIQPFHLLAIALAGCFPFPLEDCLHPPRTGLSDNLQVRLHRLIQQINRLLESLILDERRICLLCCLDRSMAEKMLNVGNRSTSTQQASGKCLSQIV